MIFKSSTPVQSNGNNTENSPPSYGDVLDQSMNTLQQRLDTYNETQTQKGGEHQQSEEEEAQKVANAMHDVGTAHTDPKARTEWHQLADKFSHATTSVRNGIVTEIKGERGRERGKSRVGSIFFGTVIGVPRFVVGTAFYAVGGAAHGVGAILGGVGSFVKGGTGRGAIGRNETKTRNVAIGTSDNGSSAPSNESKLA